jgi:hypothetical protein
MVTREQLLQAFPEFNDPAVYAPATVAFWLTQADNMLDKRRFGSNRDMAIMLWTAHNLAQGAANAKTAKAGGAPGGTSGPVSSKSVGGVSVSYDVGSTTLQGAGPYNATSYGRQFWQLARSAAYGGTIVHARGGC